MKVIGITGGTGGGKTTALDVLSGLGAKIIDCDAVYHDLLKNSDDMRCELIEEFGNILDENGEIDRKKLGRQVFENSQKLEKLNEITHKYVGIAVKKALKEEATTNDYAAAIDAIALIESGLAAECDSVIGVVAPEAVRVKRIMAREGISEDYAVMRVRSQKSEEWFRQNCSHILENNGDIEQFRAKCIDLFSQILDD